MTDATGQRTLYDRPLSHTNDPDTSYEAADKMIKSGKLQEQEELVLRAINDYLYPDDIMEIFGEEKREDFTAKQVASRTHFNIDYYTIQRRLSGLFHKSKIERTGKKRDGCCVWRILKGNFERNQL